MRWHRAIGVGVAVGIAAAVIAACQSATPTLQPTATASPKPEELRQTARAVGMATLHAIVTAQAQTPTVTPHPSWTPGPTRVPPTPWPTIPRTYPPPPVIETVYGRGDVPGSALTRLGIGYPSQVALSPDGSLLAIGTPAGVYMYDSRTMQQLWGENTLAAVREIAWSPDSKRIAARLFEWPNVLLWEARSASFSRLESSGQIVSLAWSPDGAQIAAGIVETAPDNPYHSYFNLTRWKTATAEQVAETLLATSDEGLVSGDYPTLPIGLDWSPQGSPIAVTVGERSVALIDPASSGVRGILSYSDVYGGLQRVKFSPDGKLLVAYTLEDDSDAPRGDNRAFVWRVNSGELIYMLEHDGRVADARWSPDGGRLATTTLYLRQTRVWDMATGAMLISADEGNLNLDSLVWSLYGQRFISSDRHSGEILVWDPSTGTATPVGFQFGDLASYTRGAYVGRMPDGSLLIWDSAAGVARFNFRFTAPPGLIGWSPDQTRIAGMPTKDGQPVIVWDVDSASPVQFLDDALSLEGWFTEGRDPAEWWPDYSLSATNAASHLRASGKSSGSKEITVVDTETDQTLYILTEEGVRISSLAFSPDGSLLAVGHMPGSIWARQPLLSRMDECFITIWNMRTGALVQKLVGHNGMVTDLVWSPDGSLLASASQDGTILIWPLQ